MEYAGSIFPLRDLQIRSLWEWNGVGFLDQPQLEKILKPTDVPKLVDAWKSFWPAQGRQQTWDAIGLYEDSLLVVEAKAHIKELFSEYQSKDEKNQQKIQKAIELAAHEYSSSPDSWKFPFSPFYQYCNRLAFHHFMNVNNDSSIQIKTKLLFIYFCGDSRDDGICPASQEQWYLGTGLNKGKRVATSPPYRRPAEGACKASATLGDSRYAALLGQASWSDAVLATVMCSIGQVFVLF